MSAATPLLEDLVLGHTTVLFGERQGRYPNGNSLLVRGSQAALLIDPSLGVIARRESLAGVDLVLNSHCHEDHIAGNFLFPNRPWHLHELDAPGILSLDHMMRIYGFPPQIDAPFRKILVERFHYMARPDPALFRDGARFDLGGVEVRAIHTPGHTRGHCVFHVLPDDVLYLGDIDLSSFGPYYGDAWSDLGDFERTLAAARDFQARWYASFHHIGVLEGRAAYLERLQRFAAVIGSREARLLAYLAEPHSLDEIADHRFVYRPGDAVAFAEAVERRSMGQHLERLHRAGAVREVEPGRFLAVAS